MKQFILLVLLIFSTLIVEAKKFIFPFEIIIGTADIIVIGQIDTVKGAYYKFRVEETLKGRSHRFVNVKMFTEWTCDRRFGKAVKGQKLCLFLKRKLKAWEIVNASTGERLIFNDSITLGGFERYMQPDSTFTKYRLSMSEFKKGIRDFCKSYRMIGNYRCPIKKPKFRQLCSDQQILLFKSNNDFFIWLIEKMKKYKVVKR